MADNSDKHWMHDAFSNARGQFKAKAQSAGMSTREFANIHRGSPGKLGQQARLALIGMDEDQPKMKR